MGSLETTPSYYGWRVAVAAHFGLLLGFALYACTFSVFLKPLANSFGWTRQTLASGFAFSALAVAIFSPLIGWWLDRHSPRRFLIASILVFGCAFLAMGALTHSVWQFYATCFVMGIVGNVIQMGYTQAISSWFTYRRGTALGLMLAGEGIGIILFPVAVEKLIGAAGWRVAYVSLGTLILVLSLPLALLYAHSTLEPTEPARIEQRTSGPVLASLRSYVFWIIVMVLFLTSISVNGALSQQVPLLTDRGLTTAAAAFTVSVLGGTSLAGRLLTGWLLDRIQGAVLAFLLLLIASGGIFLLAHASTVGAGCAAALLLGLGAGGTSGTTPYLLTRHFGLRGFATLYGLTWTFYAIAGGAGPILLGRMFDRTGSYASTLVVLAAATALGSLLMLLLPAYRSAPVSSENLSIYPDLRLSKQ